MGLVESSRERNQMETVGGRQFDGKGAHQTPLSQKRLHGLKRRQHHPLAIERCLQCRNKRVEAHLGHRLIEADASRRQVTRRGVAFDR
jgi:hypothetical protein